MFKKCKELWQVFAIASGDEVHFGIVGVHVQLWCLTGARDLPVDDGALFGHQIVPTSNHEQIVAVVDDIVSSPSSHQVSRLCPLSSCQIETADRRFVTRQSFRQSQSLATHHEKRAAQVNDWGVNNI